MKAVMINGIRHQTGTKLYRHGLQLAPGTYSIAIITDYPRQILSMAAIRAIVTHEQIEGQYYNYISGDYNNNGNIIYWCRHPGSGQVFGFYYGYLNETAVPSAFNPRFVDLTGINTITDTVTGL